VEQPDELRRRAGLFRRLLRSITDYRAIRAISEVSEELEFIADQMEERQRIRERAYSIWLAERRPKERDVEFWLRAEREVKGAS
jgi:hypothetical protein